MDQAAAENAASLKASDLQLSEKMASERKLATSSKLHALAWTKLRGHAERAAGDRIKLALQQEARTGRIAIEKEDRAASFQAAWNAMEYLYIQKQCLATREWLDARSSRSHVVKEFKRIKREFYRPPTPRSAHREAKLKSLSSIVLIKMEAVLFQKGIVMAHLVQQYDEDSSGFLSHGEFQVLIKDLPISLTPEQTRLVINSLDSDQDGYVGLEELEEALKVVHQYNGVAASPWRMYIDPAQDVMCYHNLVIDFVIHEHWMTDKYLLDITKSNFVAEAELEAMKHIRKQRALAWTCVQEDYASIVLARMYYLFKARTEIGRLRWKIEARRQKLDDAQRRLMATKLQCRWRRMVASRLYLARLRHNVEMIPDLIQRKMYYYNHKTKELSWNAPSRGADFLHEPQDYIVALEADQIYYVKWSLSPEVPHVRTRVKPCGYLRCSVCLKHLALLSCAVAPGAYCFHCFRTSFAAEEFVHEIRTVQRVRPIKCGVCKQERPAAWRCIRDGRKPSGRAACVYCFERMAANTGWLRL